jgi:hypothetical protein
LNDPRLEEWLALNEAALAAPHDTRAAALTWMHARRADLVASLGQTPPAGPASAELSSELTRTEAALLELGELTLTDLSKLLGDVRRVRGAAQGYRPSRPNHPAFVSKSV